ncbi:hypothetical protein MTR67_018732 [Solanum verrucosum]|uniref:Uncharacterized protein n=1 Tax=Solanum verrucosum TaxID=315347 RepID=A0AAF0QK76_SOLVR|nr:hypothetical protein MTR67_018732 [Solanum verrucosum]
MSSGGDSDRSQCISHDTYLFFVPFGTADPRAYYPNYRRLVGASSTSHAFPPRHYEDLPLQAIRRARPLSVGRISDGTPASTGTPSATPDDETPTLTPGQKDRLGRVMIEPDGSSFPLVCSYIQCTDAIWPTSFYDAEKGSGRDRNPVKDAARALKDCVRRLFTQAYHSWSEIPNSIRQTMFYEFKYWNTDKFKAMSEQVKKDRCSLKGGSLHTGGAKTIGTITREMEKEMGRTPIEPEVFKMTHVKKKENESDPDV